MTIPPFELVWPQGLINDQVPTPTDLMQLDENLKDVGDLLVQVWGAGLRTMLSTISEPLGAETTIDQVAWDYARNGWVIYHANGDFNAVEYLWGPGTVAQTQGVQPNEPDGGVTTGNIALSNTGVMLLGHGSGNATDEDRLLLSDDGGLTYANVPGLAAQTNRPRVWWTGIGDQFVVFDGDDAYRFDGTSLIAVSGTGLPSSLTFQLNAVRPGALLLGYESGPNTYLTLDGGATWEQSDTGLGAGAIAYAWFSRLGKWVGIKGSVPSAVVLSEDGVNWSSPEAPIYHGYGNEANMTDMVSMGGALVATVSLTAAGAIDGRMIFYSFDALNWYPFYLESSAVLVRKLSAGPFGLAMLLEDESLRIFGA